jgi:hypothetical protein
MLANKLIPEKIEIVDFKIISGQINNPFEFDPNEVEGHTFNVDFELSFNIIEKLVKADFKVFIETKSKIENTEEAKGHFHFVYLFHVENVEELTKTITVKGEKTIEIDGTLGNALASICYSTSRGILMTRFQGTYLENFILPVISPNKLLK